VRTRLATGVLNLAKPRCNTEIRANFFSVRMTECWNKVPEDSKIAKSVWHFKKAYRNSGAAVRGLEDKETSKERC
jgi:hypothetical protein